MMDQSPSVMEISPATETHRPTPHHEIVGALIETLGFRHIGVIHDEYAVSPDGMKMFGVLDLATEMAGCRFSIGLRNSHDKSMRLAMTCGYRVFVCSNMAFAGPGGHDEENRGSGQHWKIRGSAGVDDRFAGGLSQ